MSVVLFNDDQELGDNGTSLLLSQPVWFVLGEAWILYVVAGPRELRAFAMRSSIKRKARRLEQGITLPFLGSVPDRELNGLDSFTLWRRRPFPLKRIISEDKLYVWCAIFSEPSGIPDAKISQNTVLWCAVVPTVCFSGREERFDRWEAACNQWVLPAKGSL